MEQESWKPVVGYEGLYECSDMGRVKSLNYRNTGKEGILKPGPNDKGYLYVRLSKNGEEETYQVHQLVMQAFVGQCPDGHEVDHIDWNPRNNRLENLRYLPAKENNSRKSPEWLQNVSEANKKKAQDPEWRRKNAEGAKKRASDPEWRRKNADAMKKRSHDPIKTNSKPVDQLTLDGVFIKRWPSATDAAKELGFSQGNISLCCQGKRNKANGFRWRFAD